MAQELLAAHARGVVRVAIGRASDFFGPGVLDSAAGDRIFAHAVAGKPAQVAGNPDLPHTYTYVPDIGRALVILGERDEALGQAWHLPSAHTVSTGAFVEQVYVVQPHTDQLANPNTSLKKRHQNRKVTHIATGFKEERFVFIAEQNCRLFLFFLRTLRGELQHGLTIQLLLLIAKRKNGLTNYFR